MKYNWSVANNKYFKAALQTSSILLICKVTLWRRVMEPCSKKQNKDVYEVF